MKRFYEEELTGEGEHLKLGRHEGKEVVGCMHACSVTQSYLTLCHPTDCSPPGSSVHGIVQARILEWVTMPSSRGSSRARDQTWVTCIADRFFTI